MTEPNYILFPFPREVEKIRSYVEYGTHPGAMLPVLQNDLMHVMTHMDAYHLAKLHSVVLWMHTELPAHCLGSADNVTRWQRMGGKRGMQRSRNRLYMRHDGIVPFTTPGHFTPLDTD